MKAVKPYYISGYRSYIDGVTRLISQYLLPRRQINYKILPFMPVILFLILPLSSFRLSTVFIFFVLPGIVSALWWIYCASNFRIGIIALYKEERGKGFIDLVVALLVTFGATILWLGLLSFAVITISGLLMYIIKVLIEMLPTNILYAQIIAYYIVTLPVVIGISYATLVILKKERRKKHERN